MIVRSSPFFKHAKILLSPLDILSAHVFEVIADMCKNVNDAFRFLPHTKRFSSVRQCESTGRDNHVSELGSSKRNPSSCRMFISEMIMERTRLVLIAFHVLITVFLIHNLHPYLLFTAKPATHETRISTLLEFVNRLFAIALYHSASIIVLWHSRRYGAGMIRATGILLCGELLQLFTLVVQNALKTQTISPWRRFYDVITVWTWFVPIVITFRLAHQVTKRRKDLLQVELLVMPNSDGLMDGQGNYPLDWREERKIRAMSSLLIDCQTIK